MAERTFEIRTEPHVARIGGTVLLFEPDVAGADFMSAYVKLQDAQQTASDMLTPRKATATKHAKQADPAAIAMLDEALREFLAALLVPTSRDVFAETKIPQRVLVEIVEWCTELYGGGSGNQDDGSGPSPD
jgi:hypothetical protein